MDDTRDIAIRAGESASSAHKRLDAINGQIRRLGDSHEKMRVDFIENAEAVRDELLESQTRLATEVAESHLEVVTTVTRVETTLTNALKVAGAVVALVVAISSGVTVYFVTHHATPPPAPPVAARSR